MRRFQIRHLCLGLLACTLLGSTLLACSDDSEGNSGSGGDASSSGTGGQAATSGTGGQTSSSGGGGSSTQATSGATTSSGGGFNWCAGYIGMAAGQITDDDCGTCLDTYCEPAAKECVGGGWAAGDATGSPCEDFIACVAACACDDSSCYSSCLGTSLDQACFDCTLNVSDCQNQSCLSECQPP